MTPVYFFYIIPIMLPSEENLVKIKELWLEKGTEMKPSEFYKQYLGDYFDVANWTVQDRDWLSYLTQLRMWKDEIKKREKEEKIAERMTGLTNEAADEMQRQNRRKMILILSDLIENYEVSDSPVHKSFGIGEIRRMYNSIQSLEEKMKMTKIAKGKLGLETAKVLLPYQRMSLPEIIKLKEKLNESFGRILKLKSGELIGPNPPING